MVIVDPPREILCKKKWEWTEKHSSAFEKLKSKLIGGETLVLWNPNFKTNLTDGASPFALGGILEQKQKDIIFKVVSYVSCSCMLSTFERWEGAFEFLNFS